MLTSSNRCGLLPLALVACIASATPVLAQEAKHIILLIGDGMNLEHEIAASRYATGLDDGLSFHKLPYQGAVATWDVSSYIEPV